MLSAPRVPPLRYARATSPAAAPSARASRTRARITSRAFTPPPFAERLGRDGRELARLPPLRERSGSKPRRSLSDTREPLSALVHAGVPEDPGEASHPKPLGTILLRLPAQVQQDARDVDLDGADLIARPAEARGVRKRFRVVVVEQLRRQDRADRPRVHRPVRVAAGARIHGADVLAR